jgi:hypothetical protein
MPAIFCKILTPTVGGLVTLNPVADTRETRARASETKFLVEPQLADQIRHWARTHLEADPHGNGPFADEYLTSSLYFDTPSLDVLRRNGSYGRAKYRIRRYSNGDFAFLERKLRRPKLVAKRRTKVDLPELAVLENGHLPQAWNGAWFVRRLRARGLRPTCQVTYHRTARGVIDDGGPARLTLDDSIRAHAIEGVKFSDQLGVAVADPRLVLELKFRGYMPAAFKRLIEEFSLTQAAASKYRFGMAALGHVVSLPGDSIRESGVHA